MEVDAEAQVQFYTLMKELNDRLDVALLIVSHDIGPLREMINTVVCVNCMSCYYGPPDGFSVVAPTAGLAISYYRHLPPGGTIVLSAVALFVVAMSAVGVRRVVARRAA